MTRRNYLRLASVALMAATLCLTACRSSKRAARETESTTGTTLPEGSPEGKTTSTEKKGKTSSYVVHINENRQTAKGIRGKMSISLNTGNSSPLSASGSIKMQRDEIIQLSITALGLIELGRMELTPEYLFIQDRYHKRYIKAAWSDIPELQNAGIDFNAFQALFWNELFVPGSKAVPTAGDYELSDAGKRVRLQVKKAPQAADIIFYTDEAKELIYQTTLTSRNGKVRFDGLCSAWNKLEGKRFPSALRLCITASRSYNADFTFTSLQVDESMGKIATSVSDGKYERVSLEEILKGLHL